MRNAKRNSDTHTKQQLSLSQFGLIVIPTVVTGYTIIQTLQGLSPVEFDGDWRQSCIPTYAASTVMFFMLGQFTIPMMVSATRHGWLNATAWLVAYATCLSVALVSFLSIVKLMPLGLASLLVSPGVVMSIVYMFQQLKRDRNRMLCARGSGSGDDEKV